MTASAAGGAFIVEKLVGATGEPARVKGSAKIMAERAIPDIVKGLDGMLASPVEIAIKSVDIARVTDIRPQPGGFEAMTIVAAAISPDAMLLLIDADAIAVLIGALFGGDPEMPVTPITRDLSPTELDIANMAFKAFAMALNGSGQRSLDVRLPLRPAFTGNDIQKQNLRDGPAVKVEFSLSNPSGSGMLTMFMPQRVLLKHRAGGETGNDTTSEIWSARFEEEIKRSSVMLDAILPLDTMTLGDIAALKAGQVIAVPENATSEARLVARDRVVFICEFGKLGQYYTVRIDRPHDANQDLMEGLLPGR